jgi:pantetheine-phosphate adenylyltransferase
MKVCIGGTFNPLHKGHKLLIDKAFEVAGKQGSVFIGISTGEIIKEKKDTKSFEEREKAIKKYLNEKDFIKRATVKSIIDKYGPSIEEEFDAIVVSPETRKTADEINEKRKQIGREPLEIIQIPFVLAEDGHPISSSRIKKHEIDEDGRLLS